MAPRPHGSTATGNGFLLNNAAARIERVKTIIVRDDEDSSHAEGFAWVGVGEWAWQDLDGNSHERFLPQRSDPCSFVQ